MMGFIISQKGATLWELTHNYTLEEANLLYEALWVPLENENIAAESANKEANMKGG